jgi:hypothetical protein
MLCEVETSSKKKVIMSAIIPIITTIIVNALSRPVRPLKSEETSTTRFPGYYEITIDRNPFRM